MAKLQFLGATGTVTGSKYLFTHNQSQVLIDCGMFQGLKELRLLNWAAPPIDINKLDAIVLTHAHVDHTAYTPKLVSLGYRKPVYCSPATAELLELLWPDAAHLQEEQAEYANKKKITKHDPALPLFNRDDALEALKLVHGREFGKFHQVAEGVTARWSRVGHILGAACIELRWQENSQDRTLLFSGDLGRSEPFIHPVPEPPHQADWLVCETTYGNRDHEHVDLYAELEKVVNKAVERGGVLLVPAFAVGRTQKVLYILNKLEEQGRIPKLPVFVDSPMGINATDIYRRHPEDHSIEARLLEENGDLPITPAHLKIMRSVDESKSINNYKSNAIIISASGMITGGRIVHHASLRLPDKKNTILFCGYQAMGTRGRAIIDGAKTVKMLGQDVAVRAHIEQIFGFSAHADRNGLLGWIKKMENKPRDIFLVHGEPDSRQGFAKLLDENGYSSKSPEYKDEVELS